MKMRKLKIGLAAFLAGEMIALRHKDKDFKDRFKEAQGVDKLKVLAKGLFNFNKDLVDEIKEFDYE